MVLDSLTRTVLENPGLILGMVTISEGCELESRNFLPTKGSQLLKDIRQGGIPVGNR
jgi:hypothetical protein